MGGSCAGNSLKATNDLPPSLNLRREFSQSRGTSHCFIAGARPQLRSERAPHTRERRESEERAQGGVGRGRGAIGGWGLCR
eukprot:scaffold209434_cov31-Tisochrysis_lutea.AAC.2